MLDFVSYKKELAVTLPQSTLRHRYCKMSLYNTY